MECVADGEYVDEGGASQDESWRKKLVERKSKKFGSAKMTPNQKSN